MNSNNIMKSMVIVLSCVACGSNDPGGDSASASETNADEVGTSDSGESGDTMGTSASETGDVTGDTSTDDTTTDGDTTTDDTTTDDTTTGNVDPCDPPGSWPAPIFHTTLDDAASVTNPAAGSSDNAIIQTDPADDFVLSMCGQGVRIDEDEEGVGLRQISDDGTIQNLEYDQGTIDFWYSPFSAHDDDSDQILFHTTGPATETIRVRKAADSNNNALMVIIDDGTTRVETAVAGTDYAWSAGDWVHITFAWDTSVAPGEEMCRIYLDGVLMPADQFGFSAMLDMPDESADNEVWIGLLPSQMSILIADGIIDDFKIYDEMLSP